MRAARLLCGASMFGLALLAAPAAHANSCAVTGATLNFGSVNPISGSAVNQSTTLTVTCNWTSLIAPVNARVCLNAGIGPQSTTIDPRRMGNGANRLLYRLSGSPGLSPVWGSVATNNNPIIVTLVRPLLGISTSRTVTIYGQVLPNQFTVPTANNAATVYTESLNSVANATYGFYGIVTPPACSTLTTTAPLSLSVLATVVNNCTIAATPLNFGTRGRLATAVTATSTISVRCTNNDAYSIALNGGQNGTVAARRMLRTGGTQTVPYQLHTTAARTTLWGNGTAGTATVGGVGTGNVQTLSVFGRVPAQAAPVPGAYTDTVTATITF